MNLGTGVKKGWWGPMQVWGTGGRFPWRPCERNQPCQLAPTSSITLKELQWKYLPTHHLSGSDFNEGLKGKVVNMLASKVEKLAVMAKQKQMANKANSSARDKANPWGHPASSFVGETAGRIDARLILPKWHLATFKRFWKGTVPYVLKQGESQHVSNRLGDA